MTLFEEFKEFGSLAYQFETDDVNVMQLIANQLRTACNKENNRAYRLNEENKRPYRFIEIDLDNYNDYKSFLISLGTGVWNEDDYNTGTILIGKDRFSDDSDDSDNLVKNLESACNGLFDDLAHSEINVLILFKNFQKTRDVWKPSDWDFLRGLHTKTNISYLLFSNPPLIEYDRTASLSEFHNIFVTKRVNDYANIQ